MEQLIKEIDKLEEFAGLPTLVLDLMGLISESGTTSQDLVKRLELDEALAAYLLKQCNAAVYGIREEIRSIQRAVVLLGYSKLKMIFSDYLMRNLYHLGQTGPEQTQLWQHATAVAVMNRLLAAKVRISADEAYLAGLLHDIGRLAISHLQKERFFHLSQMIKEEKPADPTRLERRLIGYAHDQVGHLLLEKWKLSEYLKEVVRYHHNALRYQGTNKTVALTALSNSLIHNLYDGHSQPLGDLLTLCDLKVTDVNAILPEAETRIQEAWELV
jgi:putative nucleotidyltransferase with HDIG domain